MSSFNLHPNFYSKIFLIDLPLCRILLENEKNYPWLFLIPRKNNISRLMQLSSSDQLLLVKELDFVQNIIWKKFKPDQLNVAAIGNKTEQLHVHVIARYKTDPAWPGTVWDHPSRSKYEEAEKKSIVQGLCSSLSSYK